MARRFYVDITGIRQEFLDFLGYPCIFEDDEFKILVNKGSTYIIDKAKPRLFVDDVNDATLLNGPLAFRHKIPFPPNTDTAKTTDKDKKNKEKKS